MAARKLRTKHSDEVRAKIQASVIIDRLSKHIMGTVEMTPSQVRSAEILLKKSIPDLSSIELTGDPDHPLQTVNRIELVALDGNGPDSASS